MVTVEIGAGRPAPIQKIHERILHPAVGRELEQRDQHLDQDNAEKHIDQPELLRFRQGSRRDVDTDGQHQHQPGRLGRERINRQPRRRQGLLARECAGLGIELARG